MCVVEQQLNRLYNLVVFNLKADQQQDPIIISLENPSPRPICFGKEYLIYTLNASEGNRMRALPLSCLSNATNDSPLPWIEGIAIKGWCYIVPREDHFIEVIFDEYYMCISKVTIAQGKLTVALLPVIP